ncbi:porin [Paludibacterium yongneupense]|uniref:porin n=1 Tax=Paludibacterium yongneupense TaxID=400061 RepID=UPI000401E68A|nr:porin [Paludibacterium yongneupense]
MGKKIIVAAMMACPLFALADVVLYGQLKAGVQSDMLSNGEKQGRVEDYTSIVGFKGEEGLGDGLKAIWQVENRVHADGKDSEGFATRQTFVGLKSASMGSVRVGYLDSALNDMGQVDPWSYSTSLQSRYDRAGGAAPNTMSFGANGLGIFTRTAQRLKNAIRYDSPELAGFSANVTYGFGENKTATGRASDVVALGAAYRHGVFFGRYGYMREANPGEAANSVSRVANVHRIEAGYDDSGLLVVAGLQRGLGYDWSDGLSGSKSGVRLIGDQTYSASQRDLRTREAALTASYAIGAFRPKLSLARGWNQEDRFAGRLTESGYRQLVAGVDYQLSRRTTVGVSAGVIRFDKNASVATADAADEGKNTTLRTLALGLSHNF